MKTRYILYILLPLFLASCSKYLEPNLEKQLDINEVFSKRNTTERYLAHVYSFLPNEYDAIYGNFSTVSRSDESYFSWNSGVNYLNYNNGSWNPTTSNFHTWEHFYKGINQATVFMNNVDNCKEISEQNRAIMKAEVQFLRALFYTMLIRQYGPVYVWKDSEPNTSLKGDEVDRHSLDQCIEYVVNELDEAAKVLEAQKIIPDPAWYGRATYGAVLATKSRFLTYMARPLFNGCDLYKGMKNYYGDFLFPQSADATKWDDAAKAAKAVIDLAETGLYDLYKASGADPLQKGIKSYQGVYFDKWNKELIFAYWRGSGFDWNVRCAPSIVLKEGYGGYAPSLKLVDTYPMSATGRFPVTGYNADGSPVIDAASGYTESGFTTPFVHPVDGKTMQVAAHNSCVGRDARFYASIFFNGMNWINEFNGQKLVTFHSKGTSPYGHSSGDYVKVGYLFRRMSDPNNDTESGKWGSFTWPLFRLAEVYLNYAEACNEKTARDETEGLKYWNLIRERAGLNKIEEAYPEIIGNKALFTALLRKERMVELAFESHRYYDIRTWMVADTESNGKRFGRNLMAETYEDSWARTDAICTPIVCEPKHFLFPIHQSQLNEMRNITQNYGW